MKRGNTLCWLWLLMTACAPHISGTRPENSKVPVVETEGGSRPGWVTSKPVMDEYYVGIGSAKTYVPDYRRIAKDKALEDMSSEISVTIDATTFLYQNEFGSRFYEKYEAYIRSSTSEELSDFEIWNEWQDDNTYWVAYRLSRSRYHQLKKEEMEMAITMAVKHLEIAGTSEKQGEYLTAINNYLKAVDMLKKYLDQPIAANIEGDRQLIIPYCSRAIQKILHDLKIGEKAIRFNPVKASSPVITLVCRGHAARGFLLSTEDRQLMTNQNGQVVLEVNELAGQSLLTLKIPVDMWRSSWKDNVILSRFTASLQYPKFDIPVSLTTTVLHVEGEEYNLGTNVKRQRIKPELINLLSAYRFVFTDNPQKSDFRFTYKITTRQGNEASGLYVCWADVEISLYNAANEQIYSDQLLNVKGIHSSFPAAGTRAIENVAPLLKEKIIYPFIKNVF
ncbi:LPP20 family lipoprotein [Fulvivirgaceae bacterium BMA12]|uniref:LPP20 family lipoprotein n=1 Tax=Agaribacillus aureus TaxID=3051825 RepID=A0ABT8L6Q8_9BACT|nr:LPP20 family lipoprotein [Fulvivirgaceae bacterium BMA12]